MSLLSVTLFLRSPSRVGVRVGENRAECLHYCGQWANLQVNLMHRLPVTCELDFKTLELPQLG